jgi:Bromodomain
MSDNENNAATSSSPSSKMSSSQQEALKRLSKIINSFVVRSDCSPFIEPVDWRGLELYDYPAVIKKPMDLGTIKRRLERGQYMSAAYCAADVRRVWSNCMTYNAVGSDFYLLAKSFSKRFEDRYRRIRNECRSALNLFACVLFRLLTRIVFITKDDVGEEPPKSDADDDDEDEGDEDEEETEMELADASDAAVRSGDNEYNDDDNEEEELDGRSSVASGGPPSNGNESSGNKRQRSSTPPPLASLPKLDARMKFASNLLLLNGTDLGHVVSVLEQQCPSVLEGYDASSPGVSSTPLKVPEKMEINVDVLMEEHVGVFNTIQQYIADHVNKKRALACVHSNNSVKIKDVSNRRKDRKT